MFATVSLAAKHEFGVPRGNVEVESADVPFRTLRHRFSVAIPRGQVARFAEVDCDEAGAKPRVVVSRVE